MDKQRRHFSRIAFEGEASFDCGGATRPCQLLDLSLKGALLKLADHPDCAGQPCELRLDLGEDAVVSMRGHVAHCEGQRIGIFCEDIDLDSITHLRRLLELNLGDPALLERELATMISD
ncbi:MAG: PilZ domain-containing protein [Pseudazoarcus pumilus]|mgnify:CR=1 FL=1|nr:PilZ domain-containing protein [Pseudazoarcus pumilus]